MEMPGEHGGEVVGFGSSVPSSAFAEEDRADLRAAFGLPEEVLHDPDMSVDVSDRPGGRAAPEAPDSHTRIVLSGEIDYAPTVLRIDVPAPH